jgi:hypothetical protein
MPKTRTWPASICQDPTDPRLWNVQDIAGHCVFAPGLESRDHCVQAWAAMIQIFDDALDTRAALLRASS